MAVDRGASEARFSPGARRPNRQPGLLIAASVLMASLAWGCAGSAAAMAVATSEATRAGGSTSDAVPAALATTAFGLDLLRTAAYGSGNVVLSPTSVALALAMARAGAAGETATQMDAVLHDAPQAASGNGLNSLEQSLAGLSGPVKVNGQDQQLTLRIANAPFAQRGYPLEQAYLDTLAAKFGAGLRLVDFSGDIQGAKESINGWVSDQTEKRISNLLDTLDPLTRLVLVNAIYLKAPWQTPFEAAGTAGQPFTRLDGSVVSVPTMTAVVDASYARGSGWQAVELPYAGGSLAMTIVVPDDLAPFDRSLTGDEFGRIVAALAPTPVDLALPRFKTETRADLNGPLSELGMPLAFDPGRADFSGITTQERLFIAAVVHQATISVDENGTEATAATAVVMAAASIAAPQPISVRIDRPFIFAVRDTSTGAVVFLGRIVDPSA
jgi:serine protease inhibitor